MTTTAAGRDWCSLALILDGLDLEAVIGGDRRAAEEARSCLARHRSLAANKLFLKSLDVVITERCSLRCRDCSNLMQYYRRPADCDPEAVVAETAAVLDLVDGLDELRVIGGEPLRHPGWPRIVEGLLELPVGRITVYSNGTLDPGPVFRPGPAHERLFFMFTDYGPLSRHLSTIAARFDREGVRYRIEPVESWTDCAAIGPRRRSPEAARTVLGECCARNLTTLLRGALYRCPFLAHAMNLQAIPRLEKDRVRLSGQDRGAARAALAEMLTRDVLASCDYCPGRSFAADPIVPAVQIREPRPYAEV